MSCKPFAGVGQEEVETAPLYVGVQPRRHAGLDQPTARAALLLLVLVAGACSTSRGASLALWFALIALYLPASARGIVALSAPHHLRLACIAYVLAG